MIRQSTSLAGEGGYVAGESPQPSTTLRRKVRAITSALVVGVLAACSKASTDCAPTDPLCGDGGQVAASVTINSPVDTVMAVGRTTTMTATARDASGNPVSPQPSFTWTSSNTATATVNAGLVTAIAAGTTTISATANPTGTLGLRAVNANLPAVTTLVGDSLAVRLRQALSTTPRGAVSSLLTTCAGHITTGHVRGVDTCLLNLTNVSGGTNGNDNALLGVLDLFFDHARRQLGL
jgi:hypothetical protein